MNVNLYRISDSLISKDKKENIICTMDDVRGDILGPPHGTTPAAVIAYKMKLRSFKSTFMRKGIGHTAVSVN